ncbi:type II 3-dehydroquinate dehydratase [Zobellella aerophila]|uniref:3-dehydroquinate dehydratase n=2 Tax=Zobellella aerophila TaxID=870480 RepID=A0ABP6VI95_9GAMM
MNSSCSLRLSDSQKKWRIGIIDGPNIGNISQAQGGRDHHLSSWQALCDMTQQIGQGLGVEVVNFTSNYEGKILEWLHSNAQNFDALIVNPGGLTTYSEGLRHALEETRKPFVEVHFFNTVKHFAKVSPHIRLESRLTASATGLVSGFGEHSYTAALVAMANYLDDFVAHQ